MTRKKPTIGLASMCLAIVLLLSACTTTWDLERLQQAAPTGGAFTRQLAADYREFAAFEAYEMYDWIDQGHFARKGLQAAAGQSVMPERLADWRIPSAERPGIDAARARLVALLDAGARTRAPVVAARAQTHFDCWIEQQEENHQPRHITACRTGFSQAMAELEAALAPRRFVVFFDFDKAELTAAAQSVLNDATAALGHLQPAIIEARGHADRAGSKAHNQALSRRRAETIKAALTGRGLAPDAIATFADGETAPLITTADGIREPRNRRVEIIIRAARDVGA